MRKVFLERNYENINKCIFPGKGIYGIPEIKRETYQGCEWIGFNYVATKKSDREKTGVHFYIDDYQFIRLWNAPDRYIPVLKNYKYVMSPDFSIYADFPAALQIYNHYRKHWFGAYMQLNGIAVIPSICWGTPESFSWCFEGEPTQSVVSVSSVGTQMNRKSREFFLCGYREMLERLQPEQIIFFGKIPEGYQGNIIPVETFSRKFERENTNGW